MIRPLIISALALTLVVPTAMAKKGDKVIVRAGTVAPEGTPWEQQMKQTRRYFRKAGWPDQGKGLLRWAKRR